MQGKLLGAIQEAWNADTVGDLVAVGNLRPGPDFAALAPVVAWCAEEGDELAQAVLTRAGEELAEQVELVRLKMEESGEAGVVGVAYTGSVLERIAAVRESMVRALREGGVKVEVRGDAVDSLEGALWAGSLWETVLGSGEEIRTAGTRADDGSVRTGVTLFASIALPDLLGSLNAGSRHVLLYSFL